MSSDEYFILSMMKSIYESGGEGDYYELEHLQPFFSLTVSENESELYYFEKTIKQLNKSRLDFPRIYSIVFGRQLFSGLEERFKLLYDNNLLNS